MKHLPLIVLCVCLALNAYFCFRFARCVVVVDKYRSEVSSLSLAVYSYTTNVESRIADLSSPSFEIPADLSYTNRYESTSIPYRFCVVRGLPGLSSGGLSWYPVGSLMPYGVLTSCDRDFAVFDNRTYCFLSHD